MPEPTLVIRGGTVVGPRGLTRADVANGYPFESANPEELSEAATVLKLSPATRDRLLKELAALEPQLLA